MKPNSRIQLQMLVQNGVFVILLVALAMGIVWATKDLKSQWDLTQSQRNTLSQASIDVLKQLTGPVNVTAYATVQNTETDVRTLVQTFLGSYMRAKKDFKLAFVDPRAEPQKATAAGVRVDGELVVEYNGRSEHLTNFTEQDMTNLLVRLQRSTERHIAYLDGHGERKLDGKANHDLGDFGAQLGVKGFKTAPLNLAVAQEVPDNLATLVIASPRVDLLPGEVAKIKRWVEKGGNLLWLIDNDSTHGLQGLAEELGLKLTTGTVIDPRAGGLKLPATYSLATAYGQHVITDKSTMTSVFPYARRIAPADGTKWKFTPLVEVAQEGWLETGSIDKNIGFDPKTDVKGPIVVAAALERNVGDRKQRVVVTGSGHFLANQFVGTLGNLDIGVNMINWLSGDESMIAVQPKTRFDLTLERSVGMALLLFGFRYVLPLGLLVASGVIWWRRRRA